MPSSCLSLGLFTIDVGFFLLGPNDVIIPKKEVSEFRNKIIEIYV